MRRPMCCAWLAASLSAAACVLTATAGDSQPRDTAGVARRDWSHADSIADRPAAERLLAPGSASPPPGFTPVPSAVPVFLGGGEIFRVRSGVGEADAATRAAAIRARLSAAVADPRLSPDSVRLIPDADGVQVRLGSILLWRIAPDDVEGLSAGQLAGLLGELPEKLRDGIARERASRRPSRLLLGAALVAGYTLLALVLARLLLALGRRWRRVLQQWLPQRVPEVRIRGFQVLSRRHVHAVASAIARVDVLGGALLTYAWLTAVFAQFPWTQGWSWWLLHFARIQALQAARALGSAVPGLLMIGLIVICFRWLTRAASRFFDAIGSESLKLTGFHPELAAPSKRLVRVLLWVIALMIAYPYIPGAQTRAVQGISVLLGVMVSLGSTGVVGNAIAGIVLTYSRAFRVGDRVQLGDHVGDVVSLGFFATKLRSLRNEEVTLPNGQIASGAVLNYSRLAQDPGLILFTTVTIGYDVDWRKVHGLLIEAAVGVDGIEREPVPWVFQRALNDFHVSYELNAVTHRPHDQLALYSRLHEQIQDAFARAGVEILSPAYHALRDANAPVLPHVPPGPRSEPGGFRVRDRG